jgi:hypothetical protein
MWDNSPLILKQLDGVGPQIAQQLAQHKIMSIDSLTKLDAGRIEMVKV